jgi:hypothetical protein
MSADPGMAKKLNHMLARHRMGRFVPGPADTVYVKYGSHRGLRSAEDTRVSWEPRLRAFLADLGYDVRWLGPGERWEVMWEVVSA